jgi:hypothetical protein
LGLTGYFINHLMEWSAMLSLVIICSTFKMLLPVKVATAIKSHRYFWLYVGLYMTWRSPVTMLRVCVVTLLWIPALSALVNLLWAFGINILFWFPNHWVRALLYGPRLLRHKLIMVYLHARLLRYHPVSRWLAVPWYPNCPPSTRAEARNRICSQRPKTSKHKHRILPPGQAPPTRAVPFGLRAKLTLIVYVFLMGSVVGMTLAPGSSEVPPHAGITSATVPVMRTTAPVYLRQALIEPLGFMLADHARSRHAAQSRACNSSFSPEGPDQGHGTQHYEKDAVNGWTFGMHPEMQVGHRERMQQVLLGHRGTFAYSMKDLTGYTGAHPPLSLKMSHDRPIISPARRYSQLEKNITYGHQGG